MITIVSMIMCFGVSVDAFIVSLGKGMVLKKVSHREMIVVGIWFGLFHMLMPLIGWMAGESVSEHIGKFNRWVMFLALLALGIVFIKEALSDGEHESITKDLSCRTMLPLSLATSLDAFAAGLYFSVGTIDIIEGLVCIGLITGFMSAVGVYIGCRVGNKFGKPAGVLGGLLLIGIGTASLLEEYGILQVV